MALIPGVAAPDLAAALAPENEWRNISDVVRNSIKALHEIVLGQASRIAALEEEIAARPTRVTFEAQMRALEESFVHASSEASLQADRKMKALVAESEAAVSTRMQREIAEVSRQVHAKAERVQVERMVDTLQQRVDAASTHMAADMGALREVVERKCDTADVARLRSETVSLAQHRADAETLERRVETSARARAAELVAPVERSVQGLQKDAARLARRVQTESAATAEALRTAGATLDVLSEAVAQARRDVGACEGSLGRLRGEQEGQAQEVRRLSASLASKANVEEVATELSILSASVDKLAATSTKAQASLESLHASAESHAKRWDEADGAVGALREEVRAQGQALAGLRERLGEMATEVAAARGDARQAMAEMAGMRDLRDEVRRVATEVDGAAEGVRRLAPRVDGARDEMRQQGTRVAALEEAVERSLAQAMTRREWSGVARELEGLREELENRPTARDVRAWLEAKADAEGVRALAALVDKELVRRVPTVVRSRRLPP